MYHFSQEHLEKLRSQLAFKKAVVDHIKVKIQSITANIDGFDSNYAAQLAYRPLLGKVALEIIELKDSIEMLEDFMS